MIAALGHAVPGHDPVPVVRQSVGGQVVEQAVFVLHLLGQDLEALFVGLCCGEGLRERFHARCVERPACYCILQVLLEDPERLDVAGPDLLVKDAAPPVAEAVRDEAVVNVFNQRIQSERFAVELQCRMYGAGRGDAGVAEDLVAQHLAHLRLVTVHRVEVEPFESLEAQCRIEVIELQLPRQLVAGLPAVLEAEAQHAEESLVANADRLVAAPVNLDCGLHVYLGRGIGLKFGELLVADQDVVGPDRGLVEHDAEGIAALLVDADRGFGGLGRDPGRW